jgi:hypothetical protein
LNFENFSFANSLANSIFREGIGNFKVLVLISEGDLKTTGGGVSRFSRIKINYSNDGHEEKKATVYYRSRARKAGKGKSQGEFCRVSKNPFKSESLKSSTAAKIIIGSDSKRASMPKKRKSFV